MGLYSWMFADNLKKALKIGMKGYLVCPFGEFYCAYMYEGYGDFGGVDPFEMVVDWNKSFLVEQYKLLMENKEGFLKGKDEFVVKLIGKFISAGLDEEKMESALEKEYGEFNQEWKRDIGIIIASDDEDNIALPYPIKIASTMHVKYSELPPSLSDPMQGR